jgi:aminoglycoside phosphotransferase (APT) family kinase protein
MARDVTWLRDRLREHLVLGDLLTDVEPVSTGHSNETYLLHGLDLVLRMPPSGSALLTEYSMERQYHLLAAIRGFDQAPPVPGVRHLCADPEVLGDPFYLMSRVAGEIVGEYEPEPWFAAAGPELRSALCRQYVDAIAGVNRLPVLDAAGPLRSPQDTLQHWRGVAERALDDALVSRFDALLAMELPRSGSPSLVHGDPKLGNILWRDGRMQALLDWEMCFNGEPLSDLGYMLFLFPHKLHPALPGCDLPGMWDRDMIISAWSDATGRDTTGIELYEIGAVLEIAAIFSYGGRLFADGRSTDVRLERLGAFAPLLSEMAAQMLANA